MHKVKISFQSEACCYQNAEAVISVPDDATNAQIDNLVKEEVMKLISFSWVPAPDDAEVADFEVVEEDR
jgi:hypothetical protein